MTNDYYPELASKLFKLALEIREETGITLDFINLSGGIGVNYRPDEEANDIAKIGQGVHEAYDEVLRANGIENLKIYTELGRFMLAPHGHLITKVLHIKETYRKYVGVDASAVNLMRQPFMMLITTSQLLEKKKMKRLKFMILQVLYVRIMINLQKKEPFLK